MSSNLSDEGGSRRPTTPTLANTQTNGKSSAKAGLVPTNNVTTKEGLTVRTRIEPSLSVDDVIRQLCISLKLKDTHAVYALRDENDELVTNDNLRKKIKGKVNLK
jgi:engulfment and cell motility protein 1